MFLQLKFNHNFPLFFLNYRILLAICLFGLASAAVMPQQRILPVPNSLIQLEASRPILQDNSNTLLGTLINLEGNRPALPIVSDYWNNIVCRIRHIRCRPRN